MFEVKSFLRPTDEIVIFRETSEAAFEDIESIDGGFRFDTPLERSGP